METIPGTHDDPLDPERLLAQTSWLRALARGIVRDAHLAEEVVQDTLVAALEHGPRDASPGRLRAWLGTVARNFARRSHRSRVTRNYHEQQAARTEATPPIAGAELDQVRLERRLAEAVLALDEPYRSAVLLRYRRGLSHAAIAKRQNTSVAAARKRVSRGLAALRTRLDSGSSSSRQAWGAALIAFAESPQRLVGTTLSVGGIAVGTKALVSTVAAVGIVVSLVAVQRGRADQALTPGAGPDERALAKLEALTGDEPGSSRTERLPQRAEIEPNEPAAESSPREVVPSEQVRGRVINEQLEPVAGADVALRLDELSEYSVLDWDRDVEGRELARTRTDDDGRFAFQLALGRAAYLDVESEGYAVTRVHPVRAGDEIEVTLTAGATLVGRVVRADGSAVAGARVQGYRGEAPRTRLFRTETDAEGAFEATDLEPGSVQVWVAPHSDASPPVTNLSLRGGESTEAHIVVPKGLRIEGRVTARDTGDPIEGATVGEGWTFSKTATTGRDGRYVLAGFSSRSVHEIHARASGFGEVDLDVPRGTDGTAIVDFQLPRALRVTGRLVSDRGAPIGDAYVAAACSYTDWRTGRTQVNGTFTARRPDPRPPSLLVRRRRRPRDDGPSSFRRCPRGRTCSSSATSPSHPARCCAVPSSTPPVSPKGTCPFS